MQEICPIEKCTGCEVCRSACGHKAIVMHPDSEGFLRPIISPDLCIDCGLCQKLCPANAPTSSNDLPHAVYSGWSKNELIRQNSSSGGAFIEIARLILMGGGIVFGVTIDNDNSVKHICIEREDDLSLLQGSKYVQSIIGDTFIKAKKYLQQGKTVLFSGTPCQIAGLKNFLQKDYEHLYTIDLVCHGVPSPMVFKDYINWLENHINEPIRDIRFRCKKSSWIFYNMGINSHVEKRKGNILKYSYEGNYYSDPYIRLFLRDNMLRPCCYQCPYTAINRLGDFTIADWWNYKASTKEDKDFDKKGVSLIFCNTNKALDLAEKLDMHLIRRTIEDAIKTNKAFLSPFSKPSTRDLFWSDYKKMTFEEIILRWGYPEKISLSTYLRIYHRSNFLAYKSVGLYERVMRKLHLEKFIIKIQAR